MLRFPLPFHAGVCPRVSLGVGGPAALDLTVSRLLSWCLSWCPGQATALGSHTGVLSHNVTPRCKRLFLEQQTQWVQSLKGIEVTLFSDATVCVTPGLEAGAWVIYVPGHEQAGQH